MGEHTTAEAAAFVTGLINTLNGRTIARRWGPCGIIVGDRLHVFGSDEDQYRRHAWAA